MTSQQPASVPTRRWWQFSLRTIFVATLLAGVLFWVAKHLHNRNQPVMTEVGRRVRNLDEALEAARLPGRRGLYSYVGEPEIDLRLRPIYQGYRFQFEHANRWRDLMNSGDSYAQICAACILADNDPQAQALLESQCRSQDLDIRSNAAAATLWHVGRDPAKIWGIALLITLLESGDMDAPGTRDPTVHIINVLGDIGDPRAAPVLMRLLESGEEYQGSVVWALGKLKHKPALPILVERLGKLSPRSESSDAYALLIALRNIGDPMAIEPIEMFLPIAPGDTRRVAERVLIQLKEIDPVPQLLELFTYQPDVIDDLCRYDDPRVIDRLAQAARGSPSANDRVGAIRGLETIGSRSALLALAGLLSVPFPAKLDVGQYGWVGDSNFPEYFPQLIETILKKATGQNFGRNSRAWTQWLSQPIAPQGQ